jgi:hypothetical protein
LAIKAWRFNAVDHNPVKASKMTPQEKQQLKARFFGLHIACKVMARLSSETYFINKLVGVSGDTCDVAECGNFPIDSCKLILRPLSSITDEEAIECARIAGICGERMYVSRMDRAMRLEVSAESISAEICFYLSPTHPELFSFTDCAGDTALGVSDYLRSRNFALPFHGLDPISEGWAILDWKQLTNRNEPTN